jgi:hypothetical protein
LPSAAPTALSSIGRPWQSQPGMYETRRPGGALVSWGGNWREVGGRWWHTLLDLDAQDDVLEDFVQGVSCVQVAVGVGWPIVQHELVIGRAVGGLPLVEVIGASLEVLLAGLRLRTRSARVSGWVNAGTMDTYGNVDLGSRSVDAQLFDIVASRHSGGSRCWEILARRSVEICRRGRIGLTGAVHIPAPVSAPTTLNTHVYRVMCKSEKVEIRRVYYTLGCCFDVAAYYVTHAIWGIPVNSILSGRLATTR